MANIEIEDGGAIGVARSALKFSAERATDEVLIAITTHKDPDLAKLWATNSARYGAAYLKLAEARYL